MIYESTIEIERPIDEVFEAASCLRRCVTWRTTIMNPEINTEESARVGTTFSYEVKPFNHVYEVKGAITELNAPHAIRFEETGGPFDADVRFTFAPTATGTQFHIAAEVDELPVEMQPLIQNGMAKQSIERIISHEQEQLKVMLENKMNLWAMI